MSHGLYDRCECGHRHPEHSIFGICHGCLDCPIESHPMDEHLGDEDDSGNPHDPEDPAASEDPAHSEDDPEDESEDDPEDDPEDDSDAEEHPYRPCDCTRFRLVASDDQ